MKLTKRVKYKCPPAPRKQADIYLGPNFYSYCRACIDLERNGLDCFDEYGNYGGFDGRVIIEQMLRRFESLEMYKDCAFLRDFLKIYMGKFKSSL